MMDYEVSLEEKNIIIKLKTEEKNVSSVTVEM